MIKILLSFCLIKFCISPGSNGSVSNGDVDKVLTISFDYDFANLIHHDILALGSDLEYNEAVAVHGKKKADSFNINYYPFRKLTYGYASSITGTNEEAFKKEIIKSDEDNEYAVKLTIKDELNQQLILKEIIFNTIPMEFSYLVKPKQQQIDAYTNDIKADKPLKNALMFVRINRANNENGVKEPKQALFEPMGEDDLHYKGSMSRHNLALIADQTQRFSESTPKKPIPLNINAHLQIPENDYALFIEYIQSNKLECSLVIETMFKFVLDCDERQGTQNLGIILI